MHLFVSGCTSIDPSLYASCVAWKINRRQVRVVIFRTNWISRSISKYRKKEVTAKRIGCTKLEIRLHAWAQWVLGWLVGWQPCNSFQAIEMRILIFLVLSSHSARCSHTHKHTVFLNLIADYLESCCCCCCYCWFVIPRQFILYMKNPCEKWAGRSVSVRILIRWLLRKIHLACLFYG